MNNLYQAIAAVSSILSSATAILSSVTNFRTNYRKRFFLSLLFVSFLLFLIYISFWKFLNKTYVVVFSTSVFIFSISLLLSTKFFRKHRFMVVIISAIIAVVSYLSILIGELLALLYWVLWSLLAFKYRDGKIDPESADIISYLLLFNTFYVPLFPIILFDLKLHPAIMAALTFGNLFIFYDFYSRIPVTFYTPFKRLAFHFKDEKIEGIYYELKKIGHIEFIEILTEPKHKIMKRVEDLVKVDVEED